MMKYAKELIPMLPGILLTLDPGFNVDMKVQVLDQLQGGNKLTRALDKMGNKIHFAPHNFSSDSADGRH